MVLHLLPHWNLQGHEGETISVWAYSNCDEVALYVNGKLIGRKEMPKNGHLEWETTYQPGKLKAVGYKNGKRVITKVVETTGNATQMALVADRQAIKADGQDVAVCNIQLLDKKKRFVPTANQRLTISISGPATILGVGNGDPAFQAIERPTDAKATSFEVDSFNGLAQVLIQSTKEAGNITLTISGEGIASATIHINAQ